MVQIFWRNKRRFGYILYGIVLALALLYYRFPSDAARNYLQATLDRTDPRLGLSIGDVSPTYTFGLKFLNTELSHKGNPNRVFFEADRIIIRPVIWSFLQGKSKFCFDGLTYGGVLKGCIRFTEQNIKAPFTASIQLKDIKVADYDGLAGLIGRRVEGSLGGTVTYSGQYDSLIDGTGEADLSLSEGVIELLQPILELETIDFDELSIKMNLKDKRINLTHVELKGPNIQGALSGMVSLKREFLKSSLNLRGTIEPFADFFKRLTGTRYTMRFIKQRLKRGRLSFIIQGTLKDPRLRFI